MRESIYISRDINVMQILLDYVPFSIGQTP